MDRFTPQVWVKEMWDKSPLDVLAPVALGLAGANLLLAYFALRSYYTFLLTLCLLGVAFAALRTYFFLRRLAETYAKHEKLTLSIRDMQELFLPLVAALGVYGAIAPNYRLAVFFTAVTLPNILFLAYLTKHYAVVKFVPTEIPFPSFEAIGERTMFAVQAIRKIPKLTRPWKSFVARAQYPVAHPPL